MLVAANFACTRPVQQSFLNASLGEDSETIRKGTEVSFERAVFYKPREDSMAGLEMTFAPLIVQEVYGGVDPIDPSPFGAIVGRGGAAVGLHPNPLCEREREARVDPSRPTLYAGTFTTRIRGVDHDQVVFFWRYPARSDEPWCEVPISHHLSLEGRGVRITLGSDGFPLVWEALSTATDTRILYVSESLERAAVRAFGGPLPGRRYAVERPIHPATRESWGDHSMNEVSNVVVARLLDDGPVPMGPYVYLNAPPLRRVTTILCRCMPSQVSEFVETRYYDVVPLETVRDWGDTRSCVDPPPPRVHWGGTLSYWNLRIPWEEKPLDQILRWPKM